MDTFKLQFSSSSRAPTRKNELISKKLHLNSETAIVESGDHNKNGAVLKSLMSKENQNT